MALHVSEPSCGGLKVALNVPEFDEFPVGRWGER